VYHDWLVEFVSHNPQRFIGVVVVPIFEDAEQAAADLEKLARKGLRTALVGFAPPDGRPPLRDSSYDRFWATAQDLGIPVQLHIGGGNLPDPLHAHSRKEQEEGPGRMIAIDYEIMGTLTNDFIFGTILDRFPKLKIVCSEFEISWIPSYMFRIDQIQQDYAHRMPIPKLTMRASDYLRTRMWHGFIDDPYALDVLSRVGADRVVWGSDFPHIRSVGVDAQEKLAELLKGVPGKDQEKIVGGNASKAWNLD
jgi:predicted TIM-barrel fold metal-dependent hydrolase